jgi:hypothetical protein
VVVARLLRLALQSVPMPIRPRQAAEIDRQAEMWIQSASERGRFLRLVTSDSELRKLRRKVLRSFSRRRTYEPIHKIPNKAPNTNVTVMTMAIDDVTLANARSIVTKPVFFATKVKTTIAISKIRTRKAARLSIRSLQRRQAWQMDQIVYCS